MPAVTQQLRLTDTADVIRSVRWRGRDGTAYPLTSGRLVVRATEDEDDSVDPLIDVAATISGPLLELATVVIPKATIEAADFETLLNPAVWEFVITRTVDSRTLSALGGSAIWSRGVAR